jgi:hypothetical protein
VPSARILLWVTTLASLGIVLRGLVSDPLPGWYALLAMGSLLIVYGLGYLFPRWEMFGDVLSSGPEDESSVALLLLSHEALLDLTPVLSQLKAAGVTAAFFLPLPALRATLPSSLLSAGHEVGLTVAGSGVWSAFKNYRTLRRELSEGTAELARRWQCSGLGFALGAGLWGPSLFHITRRCGLNVVHATREFRGADDSLSAGMIVGISLDSADAPALLQAALASAAQRGLKIVPLRSWLLQ